MCLTADAGLVLLHDPWLPTTGTVNDAALLRRVAARGVDAATADDPAALRAWLAVAPRTSSSA